MTEHLPFQRINFTDNAFSYTDAYWGCPSLVSNDCQQHYKQLKQYDGDGEKIVEAYSETEITKAHALEIKISPKILYEYTYSAKNYIVEIEGHLTRVSPDKIITLENGEEVKEQGDSVLESYKQWTKLSKACRYSKGSFYLLPQPRLEGVTSDLFELHEQPKQGRIVQSYCYWPLPSA